MSFPEMFRVLPAPLLRLADLFLIRVSRVLEGVHTLPAAAQRRGTPVDVCGGGISVDACGVRIPV